VRIAVNHALVGVDSAVGDGDEVALLPPVTGG
jgi:molybdopterin converting factor small subunit